MAECLLGRGGIRGISLQVPSLIKPRTATHRTHCDGPTHSWLALAASSGGGDHTLHPSHRSSLLSLTRNTQGAPTGPSQMAGAGGKLVVMVAEKPSICNSIAHALCGGAELNTRGTSRDWGEGRRGSFSSPT
jgi:hypothetical protein